MFINGYWIDYTCIAPCCMTIALIVFTAVLISRNNGFPNREYDPHDEPEEEYLEDEEIEEGE